MTVIGDLQKQVDDILSARGSVARALAMGEPAKKALSAPLKGLGVSAPVVTLARPFSPFDLGDSQAAVALATKLMNLTDRNSAKGGLDGLVAAFAELAQQLLTGNPGLAQHALMLFLTHHPLAREQLTFEPLEQRQPGLVRPSPQVPARAEPTEDSLNFWREDPLLNEHHDHWHDVYPATGAPGSDPPKLADRQGELFIYMHQQMLARYDANRLSVGLPRVVPFDKYSEELLQGYDPKGLSRWMGDRFITYRARPPLVKLKDLTGKNAVSPSGAKRIAPEMKKMDEFRQMLLEAARRGTFEIRGQKTDITAANLAATLESNRASVDFNRSDPKDENNYKTYGNLHNEGHVHISNFDDNQDPKAGPGVIGDLATASRDPMFWRWHKHVDTLVQAWQERHDAHDVSDGPPVTVRKAASAGGKAESKDIILCRKDGLPDDFAAEFDGAELGAEAFGYSPERERNQWDTDFSSATVTLSSGKTVTTTAELTTEMLQRRIKIPRSDGGAEETTTINYLSHDDFYYFLRLENRSEQPQKVTVRIFLAPETDVEDRTIWVDMDRFPYQLKGQERAVVCRPAELSSVIRKPAIRPEELEAGRRPSGQSWCDCGWPYTLLLPRGTEQGMKFRLLVVITSGDDLLVDDTSKECTSISYCGLQDEKYPDKRPMGYPFDRPLSVSSTIAKHENWASRIIGIRCRNP